MTTTSPIRGASAAVSRRTSRCPAPDSLEPHLYFADLTRYSYTSVHLPGDAPVLLNLGWLDAGRAYDRGPAPANLVMHLLRMGTR